jgi:hypothetical protein
VTLNSWNAEFEDLNILLKEDGKIVLHLSIISSCVANITLLGKLDQWNNFIATTVSAVLVTT